MAPDSRAGPLDARRVAPAPGVVRLEVRHAGIDQQAFGEAFERRALHHVGIDHHAGRIEGTDREQAPAKRLGHLVHRVEALRGALADEDGVAAAIGRVGTLVLVVEQQHRFPRLGIAQLDPIGRAVRLFHPLADHAARGELCVGQAVQRKERCGVETEDAQGHGECSDGR